MATTSQPKRHTSALFHRHHNDRQSISPPEHNRPTIFEGTDAVAQNRKVAVDRAVEAYYALEQKQGTKAATADQTAATPAITNDTITLDSKVVPVPDAEVRAFKYFLRAWDPSAPQDPEFDDIIQPHKPLFDEDAVRHFFRRIALWHQSEEVLQAEKDKGRKECRRDKKEKESAIGKLWMGEKGRPEHGIRDDLKEVTTREGLAQLLWTLLHDSRKLLPPKLLQEYTEAVKEMYGIQKSMDSTSTEVPT